MKQKGNKGFTLIELLVVIAIIGILASVVLASLNSARAKGKDAAIKAQLSSMRAEMALFADGNATGYDNGCTTTTGSIAPGRLYDAAIAQSPAGGDACVDALDTWGAHSTLNAGGIFCVDSIGSAGIFTNGADTTTGLCS